jgi:hypothetical protein
VTYQSNFGHAEGIEKRLVYWRRQLERNKEYPWLGTGLLKDLVCAAKLLGADVSEFMQPDHDQPTFEVIPAEPVQQQIEYDL